MKNYWLACLAFILVSNSASATGISLVGGVDYNMDSSSATRGGRTYKVEGGMGYAAGALVSALMFEVGALYISKKFTTTVTPGGETSSNVAGLHIPAMYRAGLGPISFGLGGFYDIGISDGAGSNYGVTAGPRFGGTFFLDVRFNYGLKDGNSKDVLALLGYSFL